MLRRVEKVKYLSEYKLKLQFDNGKIKFLGEVSNTSLIITKTRRSEILIVQSLSCAGLCLKSNTKISL